MPYEIRQMGTSKRPTDGVVVAQAETAEELSEFFEPGRFALCWTYEHAPITRWSADAKGSARRKRLRRRLEAKAPLFADQLYQDEVLSRKDYYTGKTNR